MSEAAAGERLDLGVVLGAAVGVVRRDWGLLLLMVMAGMWAPTALIRIASVTFFPMLATSPGAGAKLLGEGVVGVGLVAAANVALVRIALDRMAGAQPSLRRAAGVAARRWLPVAGVLLFSDWPTLAYYAVQALGQGRQWQGWLSWGQLVWYIVTGVFLGAAAPLVIDRNASTVSALVQAAGLTARSRWRTLALSVLVTVLLYATLIAAAYAVYFGPQSVRAFAASRTVVTGFVTSLLSAFTACLQAAVYRELWRLRTGVAPGAELTVFE